MKNLILTFTVCVSTICVFAQNVDKNPNNMEASEDVSKHQVVFTENDEKNINDSTRLAVLTGVEVDIVKNEAKEKVDKDSILIELNQQIKDLNNELGAVRKGKESAVKKAEAAEKHAETVEKSLITMASNFLYIPYEAYSVENIAIKAFESIQSPKLKMEYNQRYILLKNYQSHLKEFKAYLERVQEECNGIFQATATEFIDSNDPSVDTKLILKKQPFYLEYIRYNGYEDTFIGKLIKQTESLLQAHTKQNRANLQGVLEEINKTQTTPVINSLEQVTEVIDERLKTVEDL